MGTANEQWKLQVNLKSTKQYIKIVDSSKHTYVYMYMHNASPVVLGNRWSTAWFQQALINNLTFIIEHYQ